MALLRIFTVKESKEELENLHKTTKSHRVKTRILFLLLKQSHQIDTQKDLSTYLNVSESSLRRWAKVYSELGLSEMLKISNGGKRRMVITPDIHKGLEVKLKNSSDPLLGYNDALAWVDLHYGKRFKYNTLRTYMKRHFGSKLKIPRKSHYKKNDKAIMVFKNFPIELNQIRLSLNKDTITSVNLYFQDESRFGLMTHIGRSLTSKGIKPIIKYQHAFKNTYLYGSFSPINGDYFVYEIEGTTSEIFYKYLYEFSKHKPEELKIIMIDNAGFHSLKNYEIPENIKLLRVPPYTPELNPSEKIWAYIKQFYKNKVFENLETLKIWLHAFVKDGLNKEIVKSITHNQFYNNYFNEHFEI